MPEPLYTAENCRIAYQLHWSLTVFAAQPIPPGEMWLDQLRTAVAADSIRILECHQPSQSTAQFFLSTQPQLSPADTARSIKGRLQYLLRDSIPQLWRRHYSISSVGSAKNEVVQNYVGRQVQHHPLADEKVVERLLQFQFHDPSVDLTVLRSSAHGRFSHNLHLVLENTNHLCDVREDWLSVSRAMLIAACRKKGWPLSRVGMVANHLHALLGCDVTESPRDVALSLMNNLAYAHGMKPVYERSFYVGTFGAYDEQAIRRSVADQ
jgi:REP element-mobilizing transposase RayT